MSVVERVTNIPTTHDGSIAPAREALAHVVGHVFEVRPHENGDHDQHKRDAELPEAMGGSADTLTCRDKNVQDVADIVDAPHQLEVHAL
jgi:hypothetical protein